MATHKQNVCAVKEPSTQIDACICEATERGKCSPPDSSCRHRAVIAGSGPLVVQKAHAYDTKLAIAADKARHQVLAKCNNQRARCPHKVVPVPVAADADQGGNGHTPTGEGPRGDCEIAQQVNLYRLCRSLTFRPWLTLRAVRVWHCTSGTAPITALHQPKEKRNECFLI